MDEEKIKRMREKIAYLREIGNENKAMNLERRIENAQAKKEFKENRTPSKVGKFIKKVKAKVVEKAKNVKENLPKVEVKIEKKKK